MTKLFNLKSSLREGGISSKNAYILDTSTIIHDPDAIFSFQDNDIYLPYVTIFELDSLRNAKNGRGRSAREATRLLEKLRQENPFLDGTELPGGGKLYVVGTENEFLNQLHDGQKRHDDIILDIIKNIAGKLSKKYKKVALVSKDIGMRIKAAALNIHAENYEGDRLVEDKPYRGRLESALEIPAEDFANFAKDGRILLPETVSEKIENQYAIVRPEGANSSFLAKMRSENGTFWLNKIDGDIKAANIRGKNVAQNMAMDALFDPSIELVVLVGSAGTGKTILSLATGLAQTNRKNRNTYQQIMCIKPIIPVGGQDIGYLPGSKDEKLIAWLSPFIDNLNYIGNINNKIDYADQLIADKTVQLEVITHMRGRSIPNTWMILDELQNATAKDVKTILTRAGEGTKVVALADPSQIDTPYLDKESCGITHLINSFMGQRSFAMIMFDKSERSSLAQLAADLL